MVCKRMVWRRISHSLTDLLLFSFINTVASLGCDVTVDINNHPDKGVFTSPGYPHNYEDGLQCTYKFIGRPSKRIQIEFEDFAVKGVPPRCSHDYVDIYTQLQRPDESLLEAHLHGRYCGHNVDDLPHCLISMHDVLILILYTDGSKTDRGFKGHYEFIDASQYVVGTPAPPTTCGQTVYSTQLTNGFLLSPTYPGVYPDNLFCWYKLKGTTGQRIKFTFLDLDLYSGGEHCPFDSVTIFDGETNTSPIIGVYCGKHKNIEVYSTHQYLHIEFATKSGRMEPTKSSYLQYWEIDDNRVEQKGFNASFEISERFVNLNFIRLGPHIEHVRGTECDQRVYSEGENNGTIISPNWPGSYPLGVKCHYFVDGLVDRQNLEKVRLTFNDFDIPYVGSRCDQGKISAYTEGQSLADIKERHINRNKLLCGRSPPPMLETSDPRLLLIFDTTQATVQGRGFNATYQFVTDYAIPGIPVSEGSCHFLYNSSSKKEGSFNSPRHPSNYPHNTNCTYDFVGRPDDHIRITFESYTVENRHKNCTTDYLEIYEIHGNGPNRKSYRLSRTCGHKTPGPVMAASNLVRVLFFSDNADFRSGFRAKYEFLGPSATQERCSIETIRTGVGGVLHAPNHPNKYFINSCHEWRISAKLSRAKIMLVIESFTMEGNQEDDGHGCANAALKVYINTSSEPAYEFCGENPKPKQIESQAHYIRIQFISAARAIGAKGFKITWTEIAVPTQENNSEAFCDAKQGYLCKTTKYCIHKQLVCNGDKNCGAVENPEDERDCLNGNTDQSILHIILGIVVALIVLVFIIVCILHRRRKIKKRRNKKEIEVRYVTRSAVANHYHDCPQNHHAHQFIEDNDYHSAERTLLREKTEKVSIV